MSTYTLFVYFRSDYYHLLFTDSEKAKALPVPRPEQVDTPMSSYSLQPHGL